MVNDDLDIHGDITIFCWVKLLAEIGSSTWVFCEQSSATGENCYSIRYQYNSGTRRLYFFRDNYGSGGTGVYVTKTLGTSDWNMLTLVYDNTNVYAYVNGVLAAAPVAASGSGSSSPGDHFAIGRAPSGDASSYYASALVDMVAVFNTAWSAADVRRWYAFSRGMLV